MSPGYNFGGGKAELLRKRMHAVQVATDRGYAHRCITHDRTNPYHPTDQAVEHGGWEAGWQRADREANRVVR